MDIRQLQERLQKFAVARDWEQFHTPKNLVMALTGEAGELTELFQWLTEAESQQIMQDAEMAARVRDEMADVFLYLLRLATVLQVDLGEAAQAKIERNEIRYPVETSRGSATKYNRRK
jgi:dCTP diphosphatase